MDTQSTNTSFDKSSANAGTGSQCLLVSAQHTSVGSQQDQNTPDHLSDSPTEPSTLGFLRCQTSDSCLAQCLAWIAMFMLHLRSEVANEEQECMSHREGKVTCWASHELSLASSVQQSRAGDQSVKPNLEVAGRGTRVTPGRRAYNLFMPTIAPGT